VCSISYLLLQKATLFLNNILICLKDLLSAYEDDDADGRCFFEGKRRSSSGKMNLFWWIGFLGTVYGRFGLGVLM